MRANTFMRLPNTLAFAFIAATMASVTLASQQNAQPPSPPQADQAPSHTPPVTAKMNALAHRVLSAGVKANSLGGDGLQPWHLKADFQLLEPGMQKPASGTIEEWSMSPYQWRRTYTSSRAEWNGSEWSVSLTQRYRAKPGSEEFQSTLLNTRLARPVVDALYQAANFKPEYEMNIRRATVAGVVLNCVSVVDPGRYAEDTNPDWLFPTICFDTDMHLRLVTASDTAVEFDDIQLFQGRAVARDVRVRVKGSLLSEMKVTVLESMAADADLVKPSAKATPEPYTIEPGQQRPESVLEVGATIPLGDSGFPYRGSFGVPILIRKDGSVKPNPEKQGMYPPDLYDALELALAKWKYKPYLVDGAPVEVEIVVSYGIDGKPFVPSYQRPKPPKVATSPEDFSSTYDPKRDPAKDLAMAEAQAKTGNKRILLDVGGDWCVWCRVLDTFFADHKDLRDLRDQNFVWMKVNMDSMNENYPFLSQYPKIPGYPWIFVLDADGKLLKSVDTDPLEDGAKGYSGKAIKDFLTAWKPAAGVASTQ